MEIYPKRRAIELERIGIMKKAYVTPVMEGERFVPNEYLAACYHGICDISGYVFTDTNGNGTYDSGTDKYKYYNTQCDHDYWIQGQDAKLPEKNAFVFNDREWVPDPKWYDWGNGYWIGKGEPVSVWNFDNEHVTTQMDVQNRPNHS